MRRALLVVSLSAALVAAVGCFSRSTEPVRKTEGGGYMDRLKNLKGGAKPDSKSKGVAPESEPAKAGGKAPKAGTAPDD
jgi:hypothetical protein